MESSVGTAVTNTVSFGYDKTYQLVTERGTYLSNFVPFVSFVVSDSFAYDRAGNRLATKSHKESRKRYEMKSVPGME